MSQKCCFCIPLLYGVGLIGAFKMFNLINVILTVQLSTDKVWSAITIVVEGTVCVAFAYALLFQSSLSARRQLLFVFISAAIITFIYSCYQEYQLASPENLAKLCDESERDFPE